MVTQHALCCRARDNESWEAVRRVPFDKRKFQKFELVIFVEWKAPLALLEMLVLLEILLLLEMLHLLEMLVLLEVLVLLAAYLA